MAEHDGTNDWDEVLGRSRSGASSCSGRWGATSG